MSLPPAMVSTAVGTAIAVNPIEGIFMTLNTNPYFIGLMMLLLNLGGRFIGMEVSKEQEKIFQSPWVRRALIFTVLFVATRNVFVAFIMTCFVLILMSFLFNENSDLYLLGSKPKVKEEAVQGLTPEETEIWRRLNDKQIRLSATNESKEKFTNEIPAYDIYKMNMAKLRSL